MATREEQERMALSCFQSGVLATDQVSKLTGVPFQVCRKVKREGVESGLLARRNVPERPARRRLPTSRKEQGEQRRQDNRAHDLEVFRELEEPVTSKVFAAACGCSESSAVRKLRNLIREGKVWKRRDPRNRRTVLYSLTAPE